MTDFIATSVANTMIIFITKSRKISVWISYDVVLEMFIKAHLIGIKAAKVFKSMYIPFLASYKYIHLSIQIKSGGYFKGSQNRFGKPLKTGLISVPSWRNKDGNSTIISRIKKDFEGEKNLTSNYSYVMWVNLRYLAGNSCHIEHVTEAHDSNHDYTQHFSLYMTSNIKHLSTCKSNRI